MLARTLICTAGDVLMFTSGILLVGLCWRCSITLCDLRVGELFINQWLFANSGEKTARKFPKSRDNTDKCPLVAAVTTVGRPTVCFGPSIAFLNSQKSTIQIHLIYRWWSMSNISPIEWLPHKLLQNNKIAKNVRIWKNFDDGICEIRSKTLGKCLWII